MQRMVVAMSLWLVACGGPAAPAPHSPSRLAASGPVEAGRPDEPSGPGVRRNLDDDEDVTCKVEIRTGSGLSRPVCRSSLERQVDRLQALEILAHPKHLNAF